MWELTSGKLLGTVTPPAPHMSVNLGLPGSHMDGIGPVAANVSGCKLAFMPAGSNTLLFYDTLTLELLACVPALGPDSLPFQANETVTGLSWSVWRLLATTCTLETGRWQTSVLKLGPGYNSCVVQPDAFLDGTVLASSPDGAFSCSWETDSDTIRVHDTRTGQLTIAYVVDLMRDLAGSEATGVFEILHGSWSSCGARLVLTARVVLTEVSHDQMEHLLFMHIL